MPSSQLVTPCSMCKVATTLLALVGSLQLGGGQQQPHQACDSCDSCCLNGAGCNPVQIFDRVSYDCTCPPDFSGRHCEISVCGQESIDMMLQACCSPDDQVQSSASDRLQRGAVRGCGLPRTCSAECAALFNTMFPACFSSIISKTLPEAEAQQWRDFSALCEQTDMAAKNALISRGVDPAADAVCRGSYETMSEARRRTSNSGCGCDGEDGVQRSSGHCLDFDTNCQCDGGGGQLPGKWFRVSGDAGDSIALTDPGMHRCGTAYGGWLSGWAGPHVTGFHWTSRGVGPPGDYDVPGSLPPVASGQVAATVCFSGNGGYGCYYRQAVHVVNCGAYALFRLPEIPACATGNHLDYCTAEVLPGTFVGGGD